ncbi:D-amino-acid transaminase [Terasakiella sp.]|uniref:D-amino-acid transaminase n=1 Tax=Terasakiella sp. TaxID=2034861 RepID=UPI003AA7B1EF
MSRFAYVNGAYVPHEHASVHIEDRGFQFADSVYEVIYLYKGKLIDAEAHLKRLEHSLNELDMDMPKSRAAFMVNIKELVRRNRVKTALIYVQVTRGSAARDFPYPENTLPTVVMTARRVAPFDANAPLKGIKVMSLPDIRWVRCDIKTTSLLAASMSKQKAQDSGFDDAWLLTDDLFVTEGTSNNAWILREDGKLQTRKPSHEILNGITRQAIIKLAGQKGIEIVEDAFSLDEAKKAKEAFVTSSSACVKPVIQIDDTTIADGKPGLFTQQIAKIYADFLEE